MALCKTGCHNSSVFLGCNNSTVVARLFVTHKRRKKKFNRTWSLCCQLNRSLFNNKLLKWSPNFVSKLSKQTDSRNKDKTVKKQCPLIAEEKTPCLHFSKGMINQFPITNEIQYFRDCRNHFIQMCFNDTSKSYGPPLAILLHSKNLKEDLLKKMIEIYGEKGFDIISVNATPHQLMFPCVSGGAMNVVTDLIECLNESHRCRPYVFHGFSIGSYMYGEIMAQFADQYENYRTIIDNVKGCLWDSAIDITTVKQSVGQYFYPKNWLSRWKTNRAVTKHFKDHQHDSVAYWNRSREHFSNPVAKVPNVFFVSCSDVLSNPNSMQSLLTTLQCNDVPIFQKAWWDSLHLQHFDRYCYEYLYGMILFFNLCNLYPDECGKYHCSHESYSPGSSTNKKAWDS